MHTRHRNYPWVAANAGLFGRDSLMVRIDICHAFAHLRSRICVATQMRSCMDSSMSISRLGALLKEPGDKSQNTLTSRSSHPSCQGVAHFLMKTIWNSRLDTIMTDEKIAMASSHSHTELLSWEVRRISQMTSKMARTIALLGAIPLLARQ